jgi:1-deoxy-D-xylulose-5-phosphate reductoisomerase
MRTPIAHALAYPERISSGVAPLDLASMALLRFERPDMRRFPCLKLAYDALQAGGSAPALINAANEVAVEAFLNRQIGFRMIDQLIARVMDTVPHEPITDIAGLLEQDRRARRAAQEYLQS